MPDIDTIEFVQHLAHGLVKTRANRSSIIAATYIGDATVVFFDNGASLDLRYPDETQELQQFLAPYMCSLEECLRRKDNIHSGSSNE